MTFPQIFEYLTHRRSHVSPDNGSSSCFDENQMPDWAYRYNNLEVEVRQDPSVRAQARFQMPSGQHILRVGQVASCIGLDLEVEGHHIRLENVELTLIGTTRTPNFSAYPMESSCSILAPLAVDRAVSVPRFPAIGAPLI
jgi:hypothetical protein